MTTLEGQIVSSLIIFNARNGYCVAEPHFDGCDKTDRLQVYGVPKDLNIGSGSLVSLYVKPGSLLTSHSEGKRTNLHNGYVSNFLSNDILETFQPVSRSEFLIYGNFNLSSFPFPTKDELALVFDYHFRDSFMYLNSDGGKFVGKSCFFDRDKNEFNQKNPIVALTIENVLRDLFFGIDEFIDPPIILFDRSIRNPFEIAASASRIGKKPFKMMRMRP